jgi:HEAT repeat protein
MKDTATPAEEKSAATKAIASAATGDALWGVRSDSVGALRDVPGPDARAALLAAVKDKTPRVRTRAISVLGAAKDASLAGVFLGYLNDPSYNVIRASASALGATKDPGAYSALNKLLDEPSWRDTIRVSGLTGLAALGDPRALDSAVRFAARGNPLGVRGAALSVLGAAGKNDPRAYPIISDTFTAAVESRNFQLYRAAASALIALGDPRALELVKKAQEHATDPQLQQFLGQLQKTLEDQTKKAASPQNP